jgi:hypothetical protein
VRKPNAGVSPSLAEVLENAPWSDLETHLNGLRPRVDSSITESHKLRRQFREELLAARTDLPEKIKRPSEESLKRARQLMTAGTVAAADGTVAPVALLAGSKIQVGVVIVFNSGDLVSLVTRVFEHEMNAGATSATDYFRALRTGRGTSYLVSHAIMLYGERRLLMDQKADWRMVHGELIPHELRTGAGNPLANLPAAFDLIYEYIASEKFVAVSESGNDLDVLNAAELLDPCEYIEIRTLADSLRMFVEGDEELGITAAKFSKADGEKFRKFIDAAGPQVAVVLVKAGNHPFIIECHKDHVEDAVALFLTDSLWVRGMPTDGSAFTVRGFPFHIDLADQAARTLFKGSDFRSFVEARLMHLSVEEGLFDLDPRRTR